MLSPDILPQPLVRCEQQSGCQHPFEVRALPQDVVRLHVPSSPAVAARQRRSSRSPRRSFASRPSVVPPTWSVDPHVLARAARSPSLERPLVADAGLPVSPPISVRFIDEREGTLSNPLLVSPVWLVTVGWEGQHADSDPPQVVEATACEHGLFVLGNVVINRVGFNLVKVECRTADGDYTACVPVTVLAPRPSGIAEDLWRAAWIISERVSGHRDGDMPSSIAGFAAMRNHASFPALLKHAATDPALSWVSTLASESIFPAALRLPDIPPELTRFSAAGVPDPRRRYPLQRLSRREADSYLPPSKRLRPKPIESAQRRHLRQPAPLGQPWRPGGRRRRGGGHTMGDLIAAALDPGDGRGRVKLPPLQSKEAQLPRPRTSEWENPRAGSSALAQ